MKIYVVGIHTDVGKTHFSAAFCKVFGYDYFKLIQAGEPKDSEFIHKFSPATHIFKEGIFLKTSASPHKGKRLERLNYKGLDINLPKSENLLIETAGGLFTPLDESVVMLDYISTFKHPCVLIGKYYLGAINHTLLSLEALNQRQISIKTLVMMGKKEEDFDSFINSYAKVKIVHLDFYKDKIETNAFKKAFSFILE
ncbi:ATP-dependent dethiobiotin synthetase BioD [Helicobacter apodemus]|uniref:ATP-dependent dethiobiotin synthetase BioD n=1 Tax=Helicobacter apodemus TaxID=135569 RepID=A0A4U8UG92_9HELI|nr:ATP-dependent dethiobiotin synthetase BioD [Helicobacter apodemus]TLE16663.1 ATP-dependent dethiobiotin synthetase BioD [Helicobacter apodemus]